MRTKNLSPNHYERAFENWLLDKRIPYVAFGEQNKAALTRCGIKTFDFLLYPHNGKTIIAEIKGRKFKGTSFAGLAGLECWVTKEDIAGLTQWQKIFGPDHQPVFVFVYRVENIDVDFDGREVFELGQNRYIFLCIKLDDYRNFMKGRSPKWQTVTLPADKFRKYAIRISELLP